MGEGSKVTQIHPWDWQALTDAFVKCLFTICDVSSLSGQILGQILSLLKLELVLRFPKMQVLYLVFRFHKHTLLIIWILLIIFFTIQYVY